MNHPSEEIFQQDTISDNHDINFKKNKNIYEFSCLVKKYQKNILRMGYSYFSNWHDAEEITQQVFIKAYKNISRYRGDAAFLTWLYRITINTCIDYSRKQTKRPWFGWLSVSKDNKNSIDSVKANDSVRKKLYKKEIYAVINEITESLPVKQKAAFSLFYNQDLTIKDISYILNITENNAKSLLSLARKKVKTEIAKREITSIWEVDYE